MHFWRFCWPHLEIWNLQSCIFCTFDDFIWTSWDLWSNILLCFHDCIRLLWDLQSNISWFFMTAFGIFRIYSQLIPLFPRATSQVAMLAWIFGDCREGQIPRCLQRCKFDTPLLAAGSLIFHDLFWYFAICSQFRLIFGLSKTTIQKRAKAFRPDSFIHPCNSFWKQKKNAEGGTWTRTVLLPQAPEACASANSATSAFRSSNNTSNF